MSLHAYFVFILSVSTVLPEAESGKILFMSQSFGKSHFYVFQPIIEEIVARGNHDVTLHSYFPLKNNHSKIEWFEITIPKNMDMDKLIDIEDEMTKGIVQQFKGWIPMFDGICVQLLTHDSTKALLKKGRQFDIVVVDALFPECATVLAAMLGKHTVYLFTSAFFPWAGSAVPNPPSYVPNMVASLTTKMSFWERLRNTYYYLGMNYAGKYVSLPHNQDLISKILPQAPTINDAEKQIAFHITNADPVMYAPRPSMPHIADCGAMHCGKPNPLPKDLHDFVESSGNDGFIIFGLGSGVTAAMLKPEFTNTFISVFGRLKQKVVWKYDKHLDNLPANVKTVNWMPQQDLLGHPKIRLFITHSGLLSLQEAIYHAVPVMPIPLFAEQPGNAARVKELGIGEPLNFLSVTPDGVYELVNKILNDKSYKENAKKYSAILRDQPEKPVERAVFWLEYLIRYDGAKHLKSAAEDLNFFQYFLLDVAAFMVAVVATAIGVSLYSCKLGYRMLFAKKGKKTDRNKKRD